MRRLKPNIDEDDYLEASAEIQYDEDNYFRDELLQYYNEDELDEIFDGYDL